MQSNVAELPLIDKLWAWFETNKKPVLVGAAAILVAGFVIGFMVWQKEQKEIAASNALSNVAAGLITGLNPRADSVQAYLNVAANYPNSTAAARASLLAAGSLFVDGKYPEAQAQFEKIYPILPRKSFHRGSSAGNRRRARRPRESRSICYRL
jgi:predicted negative regulator of RcsB-dependent stress response